MTHRLEPAKVSYANGWQNPAHADLPKYVANVPGLEAWDKQAVRRALRRLRRWRKDADYRPRLTTSPRATRESLRDAAEVFSVLREFA